MSAMLDSLKTKASSMKKAAVSNSVVGISSWSFDATILGKAVRAVISARTAGVMVSWDGTDPTSTLGHPVMQNLSISVLGNENIQALKFLREAAADADVTITLET